MLLFFLIHFLCLRLHFLYPEYMFYFHTCYIKNFFTFRPGQPLYGGGPKRDDQWGWLEKAPQNGYGPEGDGKFEMCTVGVAQNADYKRNCITAMSGYNVMGRSYTKGKYSYTYKYNGETITNRKGGRPSCDHGDEQKLRVIHYAMSKPRNYASDYARHVFNDWKGARRYRNADSLRKATERFLADNGLPKLPTSADAHTSFVSAINANTVIKSKLDKI